MPRGVEPCNRRNCRGEMHEQCWWPEGEGRHVWLVCDLDSRHTVDRHDPGHDERQDTLPGMETA